MVSPDCLPRAALPHVKDGRHGLPPSRAKGGNDDPGISNPPRADPAPTRPAQKRDTDTHLLVKPRIGGVTDRGPHRGSAAKGGLGEKPRGKRLATDNRHRADTDQGSVGPSPVYRGEGAGAGRYTLQLGK